jgi:gentisate 1,2-dioxygenase
VTSDRTEKLAKVNFWNELLALRDRQREQQKTAVQVVRRAELPLESNSQGNMRWYLHPSITDTVLSTLMICEQEIPPGSRSGRLAFQGGQIMFIVEGNGYTLIDGVKYQWKARDVLNLPLKRDGIVVQHFNTSDTVPARFLVVEPNLFAALGVDRGSGFEQIEAAPEFKP